ncbi:hypothetical protein J6590_023369 [Homalodisca vitripennis]|nr:hypothetical protein J6590_023369 [Homalodisca vitripennis]
MLAASVDYRHGLADVMQCGSQFSVLGSERMLAASVDYRHGLADVMQCGSQFSGLLTVSCVTVLGSSGCWQPQ